jgi:hypothetical protein
MKEKYFFLKQNITKKNMIKICQITIELFLTLQELINFKKNQQPVNSSEIKYCRVSILSLVNEDFWLMEKALGLHCFGHYYFAIILFYFILFYSFSFFPFSDPTVSWEYQMLTFHLYGENIYN